MDRSAQVYSATQRRHAARRAAGLCELCGQIRDGYSIRHCLIRLGQAGRQSAQPTLAVARHDWPRPPHPRRTHMTPADILELPYREPLACRCGGRTT